MLLRIPAIVRRLGTTKTMNVPPESRQKASCDPPGSPTSLLVA